jgi:hypothetical protein
VYYRGPVGIPVEHCELLNTEHLPHVHAKELTLVVGSVALDKCVLCPGRDQFDNRRKALDSLNLGTRELTAMFELLKPDDAETSVFGKLSDSDVSYLPMSLQRVEGDDPEVDGAMGVTLLETPGVEIQLSADEVRSTSVVGTLTVTEQSLSNGEKWLAQAAIFRFSDSARRALTNGRDGAIYVGVDFAAYNDEVDDIGWLTLEDMTTTVGARATRNPPASTSTKKSRVARDTESEPSKPVGSSVTDRDIANGEPDPANPGSVDAPAATTNAAKRLQAAQRRKKRS